MLGAVYVATTGVQPTDALPMGVDLADSPIGIIGFGAAMGANSGAQLGGVVGCLLGIIVALWKRPLSKRVTFWTAVACGVGGALIGALGGGILGSPGSRAIWVPAGILIGAMTGAAGGTMLGYVMTSPASIAKRS
jgi:hypothetical protein